MIDLSNVEHHPVIKDWISVLTDKTQNSNKSFFLAEIPYFLGKVASNMRAHINTDIFGKNIPTNMYVIALANSGFGKGHSVNIIENEFLSGFKDRFINTTFNYIAESNIKQLALDREVETGKPYDICLDELNKEFDTVGEFMYTFSEGTVPAIKQMRHKLLLSKIGAINFQVDEIGSNILDATDVLTAGLELYDLGYIKDKLIKNSNENVRFKEINGSTPTNILLFGTQSKLLDGGRIEANFNSLLDTGYARRCIFGMGTNETASFHDLTPEQIYDQLSNPQNLAIVKQWNRRFKMLADPRNYNKAIELGREVGILLIEYKTACEKYAYELDDYEHIRKAEISHRYFKALKLAGIYSFIDNLGYISKENLLRAILLVEESGKSFQSILNRESPHVKLARYIINCKVELTHSDLMERLPFYKGSTAVKNDMMNLAKAWAYNNNGIIRNRFVDGIEIFSGETLKVTNLDEMILSHSTDYAYDFEPELAPFDKLHMLTQGKGLHWANHSFKNGHRTEENSYPGFNMLVLDIDDGTPLSMVHDIFSEYTFMTYTTKRHTEEFNRYRLIFPMNYILKLNAEEYKEFMEMVRLWLPITVDESTFTRSKKWESFEGGTYHYNEGVLLDVTDFIPETSKNERYLKSFEKLESLDNLERWFADKMTPGNRNNSFIKYALALVDAGLSASDVHENVLKFNDKLGTLLTKEELEKTVLTTAAKKIQSRDKGEP